MHVFAVNFQVAEHGAVEFAKYLVVIAGHEDDLGAALGLAENGAQHIVVRLRPVHGLLHAPDVDDVADQEQVIHLDVMQEVEQQLRAAAFESQMNIRDEDRSQVAAAKGLTLTMSSSPRTCCRMPRFTIFVTTRMTPGRRFVYKKGTYAWNIAWNTKNVT